MDNDISKAKQLSEDIDRLIAGEQFGSTEIVDKDLAKNIQFAKKMLDSRAEPSPAFKENLRRRLLTRITENEIEAARQKEQSKSIWDFIGSLIPQSPVWRTVAATVVVVIVALVVTWKLGVFTEQNQPPILGTPPPTGTQTQGPVEVTAIATQSTYKAGETVDIIFTYRNIGDAEITLTPYPPQVLIAAPSLTPFKTIPGGESEVLLAGETKECTITWDQKDNQGVQVPAGEYVINMLDIQLSDGSVVTLSDSPHITIIP